MEIECHALHDVQMGLNVFKHLTPNN